MYPTDESIGRVIQKIRELHIKENTQCINVLDSDIVDFGVFIHFCAVSGMYNEMLLALETLFILGYKSNDVVLDPEIWKI